MKIQNIYFLGIKGVGMTALAIYCKQRGYKVWGSDSKENFHTDTILKKENISVLLFNKDNIDNADLVIYSGAYDISQNEEIQKAKKLGISIMSHGQALGFFMKGYKQISVSGTHGKTTTCGLIASIMVAAGMDPSYIIGAASINPLGSPGHFGKGNYFIAEADEYQTALNNDRKPRFLWQNPNILVITNIDFDHPDVYKSIEEVKYAFKQLVLKVPKKGLIVYNSADKNAQEVVSGAACQKTNFGTLPQNINLKLIGAHNIQNAAAAIAVSDFLGIKKAVVVKALNNYRGAKRRLEMIKDENGVLYYDDYAHHPTEIKASLEALKNNFKGRRLVVIFQPHTYSRTQALFKEFTQAFDKADILILTNIFASARENKDTFTISSKDLMKAIKKHKNNVFLASSKLEVIQYIKRLLKSGDIIVTMGAGDIYQIHNHL